MPEMDKLPWKPGTEPKIDFFGPSKTYMEVKKPGAIVRESRGMDSDVVEELEPGAVVIAERTVVIKHKGDARRAG